MAGIYLHIPFCKQACHYCDFHFSTSLKHKEHLLAALTQEIALQKDFLGTDPIETIYFGGGTPSLLNSDELNRLFDALSANFNLASELEITLEANPDDLTLDKIKALSNTPINRLSIGIQSFRESDLQLMNRAHTAQEADYAVKASQDAGFTNLTIDLIYGVPGLSDFDWAENLGQAFALEVPHLSCYCLTIEPQTAFASMVKKGQLTPMSDQAATAHFTQLMDLAAVQGFEHYEISNFAKPGHYSRHNSAYWRGKKYLGLGPSAHSYNTESRQWNVAHNLKYIEAISNNQIPCEVEQIDADTRFNEHILTRLRTQWGLDLSEIESTFGAQKRAHLQKAAQPFVADQHLEFTNQTYTLTRKGKFIADHISAELFN